MENAIEFENVSKQYFLGSRRANLHQLIPFLNRFGTGNAEILHALHDLSFQVRKGEVFGLVGGNGAGKTTALTLLAGISKPTSGNIRVDGRIGALIKLGAGFHPELSGRENVYLNASILGIDRHEVDRIYDDIVDFAGIERFMDTPVKRYSSGMFVRLGFAVAIHTKPDILLVDEVLSVGDVAFQSKCFNKISELRDQDVTIVMVSHNAHHIASFCDRALYLKSGEVQMVGDPGDVLTRYTKELMASQSQDEKTAGDTVYGSGRLKVTKVEFIDAHGLSVAEIDTGDSVTVRIHYDAAEPIPHPQIDIVMRDTATGNMYQATNLEYGKDLGVLAGRGIVDVTFEELPINNQLINFFVTVWDERHSELLDWKRYIKLQINGNGASSGRMLFPAQWHIRDTVQSRVYTNGVVHGD